MRERRPAGTAEIAREAPLFAQNDASRFRVSTEDLRVALTRYRSFFERLLAA